MRSRSFLLAQLESGSAWPGKQGVGWSHGKHSEYVQGGVWERTEGTEKRWKDGKVYVMGLDVVSSSLKCLKCIIIIIIVTIIITIIL